MVETRIRVLKLDTDFISTIDSELDTIISSCESEGFYHVSTGINHIKDEYFLYTLTFKQHKGIDL